MQLTTDALILRENNNIGESDRFITALSREKGLIQASVRGAQKWKSRLGSATQLLCYSRLTLTKGREKYIVTDAQPLHVFFDVRGDLERLTLASYFCELFRAVAPSEEPAEDYLRLLLNALHLLGSGNKPALLVKAATECRLLTLAGFMPSLDCCSGCGQPITGEAAFSAIRGDLTCPACPPATDAIRIPYSLVCALRHCSTAPLASCFSFTLPEEGIAALADLCEKFVHAQLQRSFSSLDFYHSIR